MDKHYIKFGLNRTDEEIENSKINFESNLQLIIDALDKYLEDLNLYYGRTMNIEKEQIIDLYKYFDYYLKPASNTAYLINKVACDKNTDINFFVIATDISHGEFEQVKARMDADLTEYCQMHKELQRKTNSEKFLARKARQLARREELAKRNQAQNYQEFEK